MLEENKMHKNRAVLDLKHCSDDDGGNNIVVPVSIWFWLTVTTLRFCVANDSKKAKQ